jgi:eukaryotic-like serine/threonine-protein kinase
MTPQQYERLTELFHAALATAPKERAAFVGQLNGSDADLQQELKLMLAAHETALTQNPPDDIAAGMLMAQQHDCVSRTTITHYEIRSLLGKGGMGEVYLADDLRLLRKVALKILPADAASNQDRMRRFEREAQALAALNHPNIAHIYEIAEQEGTHFIAMEYVEGDTMRQAIHRDKTPLETLLRYLIQVAQGLSKAHAAGIVHRDLKPENIMIARDGYAKILDFGLVKLASMQPGVEQMPTPEADDRALLARSEDPSPALRPQTDAGMVMGTKGYMSPEQAEGRTGEVDHRSDIFSFGCLLLEAATANRPLADEQFANHFYRSVPPALEKVISRCTETDPCRRYQTMEEVAADLKSAGEALFGVAEFARAGSPRVKKRTVVILTAAVIATAYGLYKVAVQERMISVRPELEISRLTATGKASSASISRDGKHVVYVVDESGRQSIWIRELETSKNVRIVGPSEATYANVSFTPDSNFIYFNQTQNDQPMSIYQISVSGGAPHKIVENVSSRAAISPDGQRIAFIRDNGSENSLIVVNSDGSEQTIVATRQRPDNFYPRAITWTPDGRSITCVTGPRAEKLVEVPLDGGPEVQIKTPLWFAVVGVEWLPDATGLVTAVLERTRSTPQLWFLSFPGGAAHRLTPDFNEYLSPSLTADASALVAIRRETTSHVWLAPDGDATRARQLTSGTSRQDGNPSVHWTPDGRIIYDSTASGSRHPWIMNAEGGDQRQLTDGPYDDQGVHVSPDGRHIVFTSNRSRDNSRFYHIYRVDLDGNHLQQLTNGGGEIAPFFSPDGAWVIYSSVKPDSWKMPAAGGEPVKLTDDSFASEISPDAQFIIHVRRSKANALTWNITITPFTGGPELKSFEVKSESRPDCDWGRDGRSIVYSLTRGGELSGVTNLWQQSLDGGPPTQLTNFKSDTFTGYDWSPDGKWLVLGRGSITSDAVLIKNFR